MKYVMLVKMIGDMKVYMPIIFPNNAVHADIANAVMDSESGEGYSVHSAGFLSPLDMKPYGESESLGVEYDPQDARRIMAADYGGLIDD